MRLDPRGYDAELRRHNEVLRRGAGVRPHDHVLDIGCGGGQTTRDAARAARSGSAHGVDVSAPAIERARGFARAEGLRNATFECADAQRHPFPPDRFDLVISRFGTMFFADPGAAFTNIGRALRPDGRLAMLVWQSAEQNEWHLTVRDFVAGPAHPAAFSLADPAAVTTLLTAAGFTAIEFTDVAEPVYYGPDVDAALAWVRGFAGVDAALNSSDPTAAARALDRLRDTLTAFVTPDGVCLGSRAWLVTARRCVR